VPSSRSPRVHEPAYLEQDFEVHALVFFRQGGPKGHTRRSAFVEAVSVASPTIVSPLATSSVAAQAGTSRRSDRKDIVRDDCERVQLFP
jgi:hypothetical protein